MATYTNPIADALSQIGSTIIDLKTQWNDATQSPAPTNTGNNYNPGPAGTNWGLVAAGIGAAIVVGILLLRRG